MIEYDSKWNSLHIQCEVVKSVSQSVFCLLLHCTSRVACTKTKNAFTCPFICRAPHTHTHRTQSQRNQMNVFWCHSIRFNSIQFDKRSHYPLNVQIVIKILDSMLCRLLCRDDSSLLRHELKWRWWRRPTKRNFFFRFDVIHRSC